MLSEYGDSLELKLSAHILKMLQKLNTMSRPSSRSCIKEVLGNLLILRFQSIARARVDKAVEGFNLSLRDGSSQSAGPALQDDGKVDSKTGSNRG